MTLDGRSDEISLMCRASQRAPFALLLTAVCCLICLSFTALHVFADESAPSVDASDTVEGDETDEGSAACEELDVDAALGELSDAELADLIADEEESAFARIDAASEKLAAEPDGAALAGEVEDRDELWFVSARRARISVDGPVGFDVWRYVDGKWTPAKVADLQSADYSIPTCFHVHGNRVSMAQANRGGWTYYTTVTAAGCRERAPLRWVVFSWPSDRCCDVGQRKDVQIKAVRAECYGYYLAWLVNSMPREARLSMLGYSFGTRVIGSALHLLGGGALRGHALANRTVDRRGIRTVLLAAALDNDHFAPGRTMHMAPTQIDRLLVSINCDDKVLKWYALLYKIVLRPRRGQQSLGYAGLAGIASMPDLRGRVEHRNLTGQAGDKHDAYGFGYLTSTFVERMRQYIYHEPLGESR